MTESGDILNILRIVQYDGTIAWYLRGRLHRDDDLPAVIHVNGDLQWVKDMQTHRDNDQPAYVGKNGYFAWYDGGKFVYDCEEWKEKI